MSPLTSILLEFSTDPLSDASPTWTDVTSYLREIEWWAGVDREGDEPEPGGATIVLRNTNRDFEPDYTAGRFYPNIDIHRRFRLTLNDGAGATQEGVWYVTDIAIDYPGRTAYSEVTMTCADGFAVLAQDDLPSLDPPDADDYADVIAFDQPTGYWRLGEPEGTKLVSHLRVRKRGKGKKRRKIKQRWKTRETRAAVEAETGSAGTYLNTPTLGQDGAILGDMDTAVLFQPDDSEDARVNMDANTFRGLRGVTVEAWVKLTDDDEAIDYFVRGPEDAGNQPIFMLFHQLGVPAFRVEVGATSTITGSALTIGVWTHLVGVWSSVTGMSLYQDAVLTASGAPGATTLDNQTQGILFISGDATIDEAAVYERALSAERILAHYTAGTERGWPQQTAGERIAEIATHALWSEASIQTTGLDVQPEMQHGQARLEVISELAHSEGPKTMFFFNGTGDPVYLGHEWKAGSSAYNTVQATLGDGAAEVPYEDIQLEYDNEVYNDVTVSHEGGELYQATDQDSIDARGRRVRTEETDVLLMNHDDVVFLGEDVLELFKEPALRPVSVTVNGTHALSQILDRDIGHLVRVKRRGEGGTAIDRVTHIIGKRKHLDPNKNLVCTWTLARGFNGSLAEWHLGVAGFSELGETTELA